MQEAIGQTILLYVCFIIVTLGVVALINRIFSGKIPKYLLVLMIFSPFLAYVPTELNTIRFGKEFSTVKVDTGFNLPVVYYRVLTINDNSAKVVFVEGKNGNHEIANVYHFDKVNGRWKFNGKWDTSWTTLGGSASEFTFPPYF